VKIIKLVAENVKRLHAVSITPEGALVTVGGKNGAGKSSVLDSIAYALGGQALVPSEPIRTGEAEAKIVVDLGDLIVTRRFKRDWLPCNANCKGNYPDGTDMTPREMHTSGCARNQFGPTNSTLTVTNKEGARYPSPQAIIDRLLGKLTFDPLAFARAEPKEQDAILRRLVGLDVTLLDARRKAAFDQRAMLKKSHAIKVAQLAALPFHEGVPAEEVPMEAISNEMLAAERLRKVAEDAERAVEQEYMRKADRVRLIAEQRATLAELQKQVAALEGHIAAGESQLAAVEHDLQAKQTAAQAARAAVPDAEALRIKITNIEVVNAAVRANVKHANAKLEVDDLTHSIAELDKAIRQADQDKVNMLATAQFPVDGLGLSDDGVTFNGHPFEQAGSAEQVRVSVAIGIALNPQLKVLLIRNGNLLDSDSLAAVAAQAEDADMQVWMEWVSEAKDGMAVMLVDGHLA
jgi:hypothetical protein